jgi:hypothetical protein
MPRAVSDDHFATGVWAADGPLRLRIYTCVVCGERAATWHGFLSHRRSSCRDRRRARPVGGQPPATENPPGSDWASPPAA